MLMTELYDTSAPKKATNLSVNADLLSKSRAMNINLSAALERTLSEELRKQAAARWVEEHREVIDCYNRGVDEHGSFGDEFRSF